jgi:hypothetical protein
MHGPYSAHMEHWKCVKYFSWEIWYAPGRPYFIQVDINMDTTEIKTSIFWDIMPCSPLKVNQSWKVSQALFAACSMLLSCLAYPSALKMAMICSSEMSAAFQRTTWRYIPEDIFLNYHRYMNLRPCIKGTSYQDMDSICLAHNRDATFSKWVIKFQIF